MKRRLLTMTLWVLYAVVVGGVCSLVYLIVHDNEWIYP
jgi:hypothetical protein